MEGKCQFRTLAIQAMKHSSIQEKCESQSAKSNGGALIQACSDALISYQNIEGVTLRSEPKVEECNVTRWKLDIFTGAGMKNQGVMSPTPAKMYIMSDILNEECHVFNNEIILN